MWGIFMDYNENIDDLGDDLPSCNNSGVCTAPKTDDDIASCIYCGKELRREPDGNWYTWDADFNPFPQPQWEQAG
jgi:hypothetical protein